MSCRMTMGGKEVTGFICSPYTPAQIEMIKKQAKAAPWQCFVNPHNCDDCPILFKRRNNEYCSKAAQRLLASLPKKKRVFKVGDEVLVRGKVTDIRLDPGYPIEVTLGDGAGMLCFSLDGRYFKSDTHRSLFHRKGKAKP